MKSITVKATFAAIMAQFIFGFSFMFTKIALGYASQDELTAFMTENMSTALLVGGWGWLVIILAIVGIILLLVNRKKFVFAPGEIMMEKGKRFKTVYLNVGMILYCVF